MKKIISVFVLVSLFVCNIASSAYADDAQTADEQVSINTIKGETAVYNASADKSFILDVNTAEGAYFVDFSILFADFNCVSTINIANSAILSVDGAGEISVLGTSAGVTAKKNQWIDVSICANPDTGVYSVDLDGTTVSGTSEMIKSLTAMILDVKNVSEDGTQIYITTPKTGSLSAGDISTPANRKYITSFGVTQGGEDAGYIRDTIDDPTGYGKGSIQRLSLNNQKWMEGRAYNVGISGGIWEVNVELYFDDFNALTNSLAGRMNGTTWLSFCTFKHSTRELVFGSRTGTEVIYSGYEMKKWYRLGAVIDFDSHSYTVYLYDNDGTCLATAEKEMDASFASLSELSLYLGDSGVNGEKTSILYVNNYSYVKSDGAGIVGVKPHRGATCCAVDGDVYIRSINTVDTSSLAGATISVPGVLSMSSSDTVKLAMGELAPNTEYDVTVSGIRDIFGNELSADISFTTGNGIVYKNLKVDGAQVTLDYSGNILSENLIVYAVAYNLDNNNMTDYDPAGVDDPTASVSEGENTVVQGYLWDSNMNILTPSVGEKQNKSSEGEPCDVTITKDYDTNIAVIKGTAKNAASLILKDEDDNIIMIDEPKASANGFFKSEFYTDAIGPVTLYINRQDGNGIKAYPEEFYTRDQVDNIVGSFGEENANIDNLITTHAKLFGFNLTEYNTVSKETVIGLMQDKEYSTFTDVVNNYNYAMAVALFNAAQDGQTAEMLEKRYESTYKFDKTKTYNYYKTVSDTVKQRIFENLAKRDDYINIEAVVSEFEAQVVLSAIECTKINSEVIPILKANNDYICLDFTNFNKVSVTANITSRIKGKKFDSIEALESSFNKLVEDELNNNPDNSNDNNVPAGTGAPKGGAGGVSTPSAINEQIKNNGVIFTDIKVVPWAEECIIYLYNKKIVDGKGDKEFKPNDNITRAEFVKLVSLAFPKASNNTSKTFSDVDENTWYAPYIKNAYANGWINGVSEDTFGVNNNISREDMAVILYRVANSLDIPIEKEKSVLFYDDDEISSYAKEAVNALAEGNIINGADNNKFLPKNTATRAEAAKLIYCLIKEAENDE